MATVCVKNVGTSPEKISTASYSCRSSKMSAMSQEPQPLDPPRLKNEEDPVDFEFLLEDPVTMLTADELFSDGKLVPLKFTGAVTSSREKPITTSVINTAAKPCRRMEVEIDPYTFSPRAPRCTVRWRELLGLKRPTKTPEEASLPSRLSTSTPNPKTASFSRFLNRSSKSFKDSDVSETSTSTSISSSRLSLSSSSSSSGHDLDDVPRLSLDHDNKPNNAPNPFARSRAHQHLRKPRRHSPADKTTERALSVTADSPRLIASGKIVFHGLERSSSSPGNFTGGPRMKHHYGMPRSQSANVRIITPVLNVPVSSLRGASKPGLSFGQLFTSSSGNNITKNRTKT